MRTLSSASRVDGARPLCLDLDFKADGRPKPLLVIMHGFSGTRKDVSADVEQLAARGLVAVAPDMRGRGDSGGRWDCNGLDVHDILDAVRDVLQAFPKEIDPKNLNIVGYSGGGANAIACAARFPDLFQTAVSFFGITDYGAWYQTRGRPDCNQKMDQALGGPPERFPEVYAARNFCPAAGNIRSTALHFFWDEEEAECPPAMTETFIEEYRRAGLKRLTIHLSRKTDPHRWKHGYRSGIPSLSAPADDLYLPDVLSPKAAAPAFPERGRLVVPGYLVTRRFSVWVGESRRGTVAGRVTVSYDLSGAQPRVEVVENPSGLPVEIELSNFGDGLTNAE